MQLQVKLEGFGALERRLQALPDRLAKKVLGAAMRSGATIIKRQVISNVRRTFGTHDNPGGPAPLARSIKTKSFRVSRHGLRSAILVGPSADAFHGLFLERGWKVRKKRKGPVLAQVPARPFLAPAFASSSRQALAKIEERLRIGIEREAARA